MSNVINLLTLVIIFGIVMTELQPLLFLPGDMRIGNWGVDFIFLRFIMIPIVCLAALSLSFVNLATSGKKVKGHYFTHDFISVVVSSGCLLSLYFHPVPWILDWLE